jgi:oxygen-independent coproporphyrinogen-3 oxidase
MARDAGFDNISLDLLYDIPAQSTDSWRRTLDAALALEPEHVSAYALDLTGAGGTADHLPVSPGARQWRARARAQQDDDRAAIMYETADGAFALAGLRWYELSNWARPGRESRHNLAYWRGEPWEAVGPGAHAFDGRRTRRWNAARLQDYLNALSAGDGSAARLPPGDFETTDEPTAVAEAAILRLRTSDGLNAAGAGPFPEAVNWARSGGLVEEGPGNVRLTMRGRLLSNEVFLRLLPEPVAATTA